MKLLGVEAGRGIAALLVVLLHASHILAIPNYSSHLAFDGLFEFGHAGVDFFFVLSGFIIYYIHQADIGHPSALTGYGAKRCVRIYPVYWVVTALFGAILFFSPTKDRSEQQLATIVTSLFLLPAMQAPILSVAWSLKHEILFYLLFATLFLSHRLGWAVMGVWGLLTAWNIAVSWATGTPYFDGIAGDLLFRIFNIEFFFGIAVAHLALRSRARYGRTLLVAGAALFLATGLLESFGPYFGRNGRRATSRLQPARPWRFTASSPQNAPAG